MSVREKEKALLSIEQKVEAFLAYLELENYDMLRYHMQACGKLMDEAPLVRHVTREGGHMHDGHIHVGNPSEDERNLYLRPTVDRAGNLYRKRKLAKKPIKVAVAATAKYLKRAYLQYSTGRHKRGRGEPFMEKCGFLNLLRDCQLLDNKTTLLDLADFVDKELEGRSEQSQGNSTSVPSSSNGQETSSSNQYSSKPLSIEDIDHLLRKTATLKYPDADEDDALVKLYEINIGPFIKQSKGADETLVQLFTDQVLNAVKKHSKALKVVYSHYATLSLVSFHHSHWKAVRRANRALTLDEYVTFMLNFEVAPTLFNHHDIEEVFDASNQNLQFNEDRLVWMNFSQFIESILRLGIRVVNSLESKISSTSTTITELNSFKKFVSRLPTEESRMYFTNVLSTRRKKVHEKIVRSLAFVTRLQKSQQPENPNGRLPLRTKRGAEDPKEATLGAPNMKPNSLADESGPDLPVDDNIKTVWAEEEDASMEHKQMLALQKKQEALNVSLKSLGSYIQEDLGGQPVEKQQDLSDFIESTLELDEFEERLKRASWKHPQDEMKGWKTGTWSPTSTMRH